MTEERPLIKVVVVGDGAVGKTCLLMSYTAKVFPDKYVPTIFNNTTKEMTLKTDGSITDKVNLNLWDTAGQEEFDRIRYLSYRDTHVFFFCYSCVDADSFSNIKSKWLPEVDFHMKNQSPPTKMLVGLKCDLLTDKKTMDDLKRENKNFVARSTAETFAKEKGMGFMEVSALKLINVEEVFNLAIENFLGGRENEAISAQGGVCPCEIL